MTPEEIRELLAAPSVTTEDGTRYFPWEREEEAIDAHMHTAYNAREIGSPAWVETYDWHLRRMRWLQFNV